MHDGGYGPMFCGWYSQGNDNAYSNCVCFGFGGIGILVALEVLFCNFPCNPMDVLTYNLLMSKIMT